MNKICVYAIAKNESKNVKMWVDSMSAADHIIVLDTGSEDNTVELLQSLGVEVHQKKYNHFRFDEARNNSLDLVPDEYNIRVCTDLDERFENDNWAEILKNKWDENNPRVLYHYVWNHTKNDEPGLQFDINKIHGKDKNLRWVGAVHEHLTFMDTGERKFTKFIDLRKEIILHHYADNTKDRRFYIDLAEERLKENADDWYGYVLLGNEYRVKGFPEKAIEKYQYIIDNFQQTLNSVELAGMYYVLGDAYLKINNAIDAMVCFSNGIAINKTYRDNYCGLATIYVNSNMFDAAIGLLKQALKITVQANYWMEDSLSWTYGLYDILGYAYYHNGDYADAVATAACALSYEPTNAILQNNYNNYIQKLKTIKGGE